MKINQKKKNRNNPIIIGIICILLILLGIIGTQYVKTNINILGVQTATGSAMSLISNLIGPTAPISDPRLQCTMSTFTDTFNEAKINTTRWSIVDEIQNEGGSYGNIEQLQIEPLHYFVAGTGKVRLNTGKQTNGEYSRSRNLRQKLQSIGNYEISADIQDITRYTSTNPATFGINKSTTGKRDILNVTQKNTGEFHIAIWNETNGVVKSSKVTIVKNINTVYLKMARINTQLFGYVNINGNGWQLIGTINDSTFTEAGTFSIHTWNEFSDNPNSTVQVGANTYSYGCPDPKKYPVVNPTITPTTTIPPKPTVIPTNPITPTPTSTATDSAVIRKVMIIDFNPMLSSVGKKVREYYGWNDPIPMEANYIASVKQATRGYVTYSIVQRLANVNVFPTKSSGHVMTGDEYIDIMKGSPNAYKEQTINYNKVLTDYDVCGKVNRGEIDELWLWGAPWFGYYEAIMTGPNAFFTNAWPLTGNTCTRPLHIMGFSYERRLPEMLEDLAHRIEGTMKYNVFNGWFSGGNTDFDRFTKGKTFHPTEGSFPFGCGSVHEPFNATSGYDWSNTTMVANTCESWGNYPPAPTITKLANCTLWGCTGEGYLKYWMGKIPNVPGTTNGKYNNWWKYIVNNSSPAVIQAAQIETTLVDPTGTQYGTFQSYNQKVVSNAYGIFTTAMHSRNPAYTENVWRLSRSTDAGKTFTTVYESTNGTHPPIIETDSKGRIFLMHPDWAGGKTDVILYIFSPETNFSKPKKAIWSNADTGQKYSMILDEATKQIYYAMAFTKDMKFFVLGYNETTTGLTVTVKKTIDFTGAIARPHYPLLQMDTDGTIYFAWTTAKNDGTDAYWSAHAAKSKDKGMTWTNLKGQALSAPIIADTQGITEMINKQEELGVKGIIHNWLSSMMILNGKAHFMYLSQTSPLNAQHYVRFDLKTGTKEKDIYPKWAGETMEIIGFDGALIKNPKTSTLYAIGKSGANKITALTSSDNGSTWHDYAQGPKLENPWSIGAAKLTNDAGDIFGSYTENNSGKIYFYTIKAPIK